MVLLPSQICSLTLPPWRLVAHWCCPAPLLAITSGSNSSSCSRTCYGLLLSFLLGGLHAHFIRLLFNIHLKHSSSSLLSLLLLVPIQLLWLQPHHPCPAPSVSRKENILRVLVVRERRVQYVWVNVNSNAIMLFIVVDYRQRRLSMNALLLVGQYH